MAALSDNLNDWDSESLALVKGFYESPVGMDGLEESPVWENLSVYMWFICMKNLSICLNCYNSYSYYYIV